MAKYMERILQNPHDPNRGLVGNCFQCCVAMILDLPLKDVPHFVRDYPDTWYEETVKFASSHGYAMVGLRPTEDGDWSGISILCQEGMAVITTGLSPRATSSIRGTEGYVLHSVVQVFDGRKFITLDPHVDGGGIKNPIVDMIMFLPKHKARVIKARRVATEPGRRCCAPGCGDKIKSPEATIELTFPNGVVNYAEEGCLDWVENGHPDYGCPRGKIEWEED
jgi:hypothetical protein